MADYQVPLTPTPQTFSMVLPNGLTYNFRLIFNFTPNPCWLLDIADANGNPLVCGIPLVTGADLLAQYAYLGLACKMWCSSLPTFANLGVTAFLMLEG